MNVENQKKVFLMVVQNLDDLNDLMKISNSRVDATLIAKALNARIIDLKTNNTNDYLASLLLMALNDIAEVIKVNAQDINKVMILNYINTILEELNLKELEYELI